MEHIEDLVHQYYWVNDYNCATTTLLTLGKEFKIDISEQLIDAAVGMHGAGKFGAQCGLVEGSLMFIGIIGGYYKFDNKIIVDLCNQFAKEFTEVFSSLNCRDLRPNGFNESDPSHLCEGITVKAVSWSLTFIKRNLLD